MGLQAMHWGIGYCIYSFEYVSYRPNKRR